MSRQAGPPIQSATRPPKRRTDRIWWQDGRNYPVQFLTFVKGSIAPPRNAVAAAKKGLIMHIFRWCRCALGVLAAGLMISLSGIAVVPGHALEPRQQGAQDASDAAAQQLGSRFILSAHDGRTLTDEHFRGRHMLVFFGYTHCPDVCPTSLMTLARVMELLGADADKVQPVFITVDPERDTREVLASFVAHFDKRIVALTGPQAMIDRVAKGYHVKYAKVPGSGDSAFYTVDHTSTMFHMGPQGEFIARIPYETPAEDIAKALRAGFTK